LKLRLSIVLSLEDDQVIGLFIGPPLHSNSNINFVYKMMAT